MPNFQKGQDSTFPPCQMNNCMSTPLPYSPWRLICSNLLKMGSQLLFCPKNLLYHITCGQSWALMSIPLWCLTKKLAWGRWRSLRVKTDSFSLCSALGEWRNVLNITRVFWWLADFWKSLLDLWFDWSLLLCFYSLVAMSKLFVLYF